MTAHKQHAITCDIAWCYSRSPWADSKYLARVLARADGWTRRAGRDYCPDHQNEGNKP